MGGCGSTNSIKVPHEKRYRRAIKLYQVTEVKSLTNLLNRNKCFESGESPLTLAAQEGHEAIIQSLIISGADVNKLDNNGRAPLHIAVQLNDEETVEILLQASANPNKYDTTNTTPLHLACESGNYNLVSKLIKAGACVNENNKGLSPLMFAVIHGNAECLEEVLRHGANPNEYDSRGNTALHVAVRNKDALCTRLLLEYKADPNMSSHDPTTLLCLACLVGSAETVKLLIDLAEADLTHQREDEPPPIIAATAVGNADCIDVLLSHGSDANATDKRGMTAIQLAVNIVVDPSKEQFYCKYFSNLYRQYSKYDIGNVSHENSTRCAMSLVTGGAKVDKVWDKFAKLFPLPEGISFEQMVLGEVLVQCFGFRTLAPQTLKYFVSKLLHIHEHGLLKLLYSAGVDPTWGDESQMGISTDENDRELYRWIKKLRSTPRSLKDLSRKTIRRCISSNVLHQVNALPILSEDMKEYVCIMDTAHYSVDPEDSPSHSNNQETHQKNSKKEVSNNNKHRNQSENQKVETAIPVANGHIHLHDGLNNGYKPVVDKPIETIVDEIQLSVRNDKSVVLPLDETASFGSPIAAEITSEDKTFDEENFEVSASDNYEHLDTSATDKCSEPSEPDYITLDPEFCAKANILAYLKETNFGLECNDDGLPSMSSENQFDQVTNVVELSNYDNSAVQSQMDNPLDYLPVEGTGPDIDCLDNFLRLEEVNLIPRVANGDIQTPCTAPPNNEDNTNEPKNVSQENNQTMDNHVHQNNDDGMEDDLEIALKIVEDWDESSDIT